MCGKMPIWLWNGSTSGWREEKQIAFSFFLFNKKWSFLLRTIILYLKFSVLLWTYAMTMLEQDFLFLAVERVEYACAMVCILFLTINNWRSHSVDCLQDGFFSSQIRFLFFLLFKLHSEQPSFRVFFFFPTTASVVMLVTYLSYFAFFEAAPWTTQNKSLIQIQD